MTSVNTNNAITATRESGSIARFSCWPGHRSCDFAHVTTATTDSCNPNVSKMNNNNSGGKKCKSYNFGRILGNGSFGIVCEARCVNTGEQVAVKKVLQDPRYKNRELDVMKELSHPNIVELRDYFYTESIPTGGDQQSRDPQKFLNVVMEHIPDTVYRVLKTFVRNNQPLPILLVRLYTYQLCRSLGYLHSLEICHRDIKPQNLLVNPKTHVLKLCDFGSAKRLVRSEHSVAYICSRFYRAPELMLGATEYTTAIDLWSAGCVLGELLLGRPLFSGETSVDQLVKIIQVLGTPNQREMQAMNPSYQEFRFPNVRNRNWRQIMSTAVGGGHHIPDEALSLLDELLRYDPLRRITGYEALGHPFFDPLRDVSLSRRRKRRGGGKPNGGGNEEKGDQGNEDYEDADNGDEEEFIIPDLFNFTDYEIQCMTPECINKVIPEWYRQEMETKNNWNNSQDKILLAPSTSGGLLQRGYSSSSSSLYYLGSSSYSHLDSYPHMHPPPAPLTTTLVPNTSHNYHPSTSINPVAPHCSSSSSSLQAAANFPSYVNHTTATTTSDDAYNHNPYGTTTTGRDHSSGNHHPALSSSSVVKVPPSNPSILNTHSTNYFPLQQSLGATMKRDKNLLSTKQ